MLSLQPKREFSKVNLLTFINEITILHCCSLVLEPGTLSDSGVFTEGGGIMTFSPLDAEGALMNGKRPDPFDALSVQNGAIFCRKRPKS